jgi:hypothetical protein
MSDMDFIMLYFVGTTVTLGVITAFAYALRRQYKRDRDSESFVLEQSLNASLGDWGPPGVGKTFPTVPFNGSERNVCGVCGIWTMGNICSECVTWAEVQSIRCENNFDVTLGDRMVELKRRRKAAGW